MVTLGFVLVLIQDPVIQATPVKCVILVASTRTISVPFSVLFFFRVCGVLRWSGDNL